MTEWTGAMAPTLDEIEAMAREVIARLPESFAAHARDVVLKVEDVADDDVLDELQIDDPLELTGLYDGIPLTEAASIDTSPMMPSVHSIRSRSSLKRQ